MSIHHISSLIEMLSVTPASIFQITYNREAKSFYLGRTLSFSFYTNKDFKEAKDVLSIYFSLEANSGKDLIDVFFGTAWGDEAVRPAISWQLRIPESLDFSRGSTSQQPITT